MRRVKHTFVFICLASCLLTGNHFFAQQNKIDSLRSLLTRDTEDTLRIKNFNAFAWAVMYSDMDTAILLGEQALQLCKELHRRDIKNIEMLEANTIGQMGVYYKLKADYPKALDYLMQALQIDEKINNKKGIAIRTGNLGLVYECQANYSKALDYYFNALKIFEELGDRNKIAIQYGNMANVYEETGNYPKALDYYFKTLKIAEELGDKERISIQLGNIAGAYSDQATELAPSSQKEELLDKALDYNVRALKVYEERVDRHGSAITLANIGFIWWSKGEYTRALDYYSRTLKIAEELGDKNEMAHVLVNFGTVYTTLGRYKEASAVLFRALALSDSIGAKSVMDEVYKNLSELYTASTLPLPDTAGGKALNKEEMRLRALYYYKNYITLRDTLFSEENNKQFMYKELNFEFEKKESLIKAEHEKQMAVALAESRRQKLVIWLIAVLAIAVAIILAIIFQSLRVTRNQKLIIEKKNMHITDSINYAQRIQNAILPKSDFVQSLFDNHFIFFQPKDIVSGDFYWAGRKDDKIIFAVADCTGHGVPGAFMSMIGNSLLNEIVNEKGITEPDQILDRLRNEIIRALKQTDDPGSQRDGMDIALFVLDKTKNTFEFSGAHNSLYHFRNGVFTELKGDPQSIGYEKTPDRTFTKSSIDIQKGDTIYLFTDGFADQKGGDTKKKFYYQAFQQLLASLQHETMLKQEEILRNTFNEWKGDFGQVDDVLVTGIRL